MTKTEPDYTTLAVAYFEYFDERAMAFCDELEERIAKIETRLVALAQEPPPPRQSPPPAPA